MLRVLEWWKEMVDRGYYVYTGVTQDYTGEAAAFITQRFAMHLNSTAGLANFIRFSTVLGYELGVAPLIIPDENARAGVATGGGAIWLTAEHPQAELEAARDFMFFLTSSENIAIWHQVTGYIPNRTSSLQLLEQEGWFEQNPFYRIAVDQMLNTTPTPATAGAVLGTATEMRQFVEEAVQSVIDQGEDPAAALEAAKQRADEALQAYNEVMGS
jgi:sn-glycerol 3-phosphate transport system substrate-binding protein